jgi:hypothetical protein
MIRHYYTTGSTCWGHAIAMKTGGTSQGDLGKWLGHGPRNASPIVVGDQLAVTMNSGKVGLFMVEKIEYYRDPPDMWKADVRWLSYEDEQ